MMMLPSLKMTAAGYARVSATTVVSPSLPGQTQVDIDLSTPKRHEDPCKKDAHVKGLRQRIFSTTLPQTCHRTAHRAKGGGAFHKTLYMASSGLKKPQRNPKQHPNPQPPTGPMSLSLNFQILHFKPDLPNVITQKRKFCKRPNHHAMQPLNP